MIQYKKIGGLAAVILFAMGFSVLAADPLAPKQENIQTGVKINTANVGGAEVRTREEDGSTYVVWTLAEIRKDALAAADFDIGGVHIGDSVPDLVAKFGAPEKVRKGNVDDYYFFKNAAATYRKPLPYGEATAVKIGINPAKVTQGIVSLRTETQALPTGRGLAVGNSRENILRVYGAPKQVLYDPESHQTYYHYALPAENLSLVFVVKNLQIQSILSEKVMGKDFGQGLHSDEYALMGIKTGSIYKEPDWTVWEMHVEQKNKEFWLFGDYGVCVDKKTQQIERVFLSSPNITTAKGIAIGDSATTLYHIYGDPEVLDQGKDGEPDLLYYADPKQRDNYLVFAVDKKKSEVIDIILTNQRIYKFATREERYGIQEE